MKIIIFTSNAVRHKFLANTLAKNADDALVICECRKNDSADENSEQQLSAIGEHFKLRYQTEMDYFSGNDFFSAKTIPLLHKEANLPYIYNIVKDFKPDLMFCFGTSIIKEPLLSMLEPGRFINLHLGLSPYYRGSGTNFWPFVNDELEYIGSTILHIDSGVDTGDIIAHVRPKIEIGDNVHTIGCKVIKESVSALVKIIGIIREGKNLNRVNQWEVSNDRYYKNSDFNEDILLKYKKNLEDGMIEKYLNKPEKNIKLITL